jgi:predicted component of type VI protein secretion system
LFEILVRAASTEDSIENTTKVLNKSPSVNDIRYHFTKIDNFEKLESQINLTLKSRIPCRVQKAYQKLAIDLNLIPYYGEPDIEVQSLYL